VPVITSADYAFAWEAGYGGDGCRARESASVQAAASGADSGHGAEAGSVPGTPSGPDSGHAAEGGSVHVMLAGADSGHAAETGSAGTGTVPHSADSAHGTESAFYYRGNAEAGNAAEGFRVAVSGVEAASAADVPMRAWPGSRDAARAGDAPLRAWPGSADAGHGTEAARPFPAASADSAHGADAAHETGVWTYTQTGVRLLLPPPYRHDRTAAARVEAAAARLAGRVPWARVRRRVRSADSSHSAEQGQIAGG
jgi:hypothetical protein